MKLIPLLPLLGSLAVATACRTGQAEAMYEDAEIPCTCGSPDALFDGCANSLCMNGENNPSNPECTCGSLRIGPTGGN
jgi:hypothetical protein